MKYRDLIQFEPINEVVKFDRLGEDDYRSSLVKNFVFSESYTKGIIPMVARMLDYTATYETFGLQVVGNYGTGKSHLMSLFSLIAENADYLPLINNNDAKRVLQNIAGKYKVIRFELGNDDELWRIVCYQIDKSLQEFGIDYSIAADDSPANYYNKLQSMMSHFEEKYPDKGLMIVIDEMLSYLKGRSDSAKLNRDLAVLQALGHMSDHSRFRMVFGAQELIYTAPELQFAADMLKRVNQRYKLLEITQLDVQYVVQQRLLKKSDAQKHVVQKHLSQFVRFFPDMHSDLDKYVNLFPVHPSFFKNFQDIKTEQSQRQILKTLTDKFKLILDKDVPEKEPGLICYDSYWVDLEGPDFQMYADIRTVKEIMHTIHTKIDDNFTAGRKGKAPLAHRIADACAIKILQGSLLNTNGAKVETLVDDLCYIDESCFDRDFLIDKVNDTAKQIVTATVGQFFEQNETNEEYHLRVEGGVNYEQKIKDFAQTMGADAKDAYFFNFLSEFLPIEVDQYRREFKIFKHQIDWVSHKIMLDGYIFMGSPAERSTTQPEQYFYIYFMPIFSDSSHDYDEEPDSVYFKLDNISDDMKDLLTLYASANALMASSDSSQQGNYKIYRDKYVAALKSMFDRQFRENCEVIYQGEAQTIPPQMMAGESKIDVVSNIASMLLEDHFCQRMPDYPKFTLLNGVISTQNRYNLLRMARQRIATGNSSHEGDAILAAMGLLQENQLSSEGCIYALNVKNQLETKGIGQVVNRDELLYNFYPEDNIWRTKDYDIDADLEFVVLAAMVALGEIELYMPGGKNINAQNLKEVVDMPADAFYQFTHVSHPKGMNVAAVRELFLGIVGRDLTPQIENPNVYEQLVVEAKKLAAKAVTMASKIQGGIVLEDIVILSDGDAKMLGDRLTVLARMCDQAQQYNTYAKMRNLKKEWTPEQIKRIFQTRAEIDNIESMMQFRDDLQAPVNYLVQARQYLVNDEQRSKFNNVLDRLPQVVDQRDNKQVVDAYKAELKKLAEWYADWYLEQYNKMHITAIEAAEKNRIMQSQPKLTLEIICGADHAHDYVMVCDQFSVWCNRMAELNPTSTYVTREAILRTPYTGGFNPAMYQGKTLPTLAQQKEELDAMFNATDEALHATFDDPRLKANVADLLNKSETEMLNRYMNGREELSTGNAQRLMDILHKLQRGIQRIEVSMQELRSRFNHALTPKEAKKIFTAYVDELTAGYNEENIRIIIK